MGGGDLLNLLIEKDVFEENFARFYIAEVRTLPRRRGRFSLRPLADDSGHRAMSQARVYPPRH